MKQAYFAGGCFWCITPVFAELDGVISVVCGYSGGEEPAPSYEQVKAHLTGHRESICISYDEDRLRFEELLSLFIANIDPFDGEGQFIDRGFSYTPAVYFTDESEKRAAQAALAQLAVNSNKAPCVAIEAFGQFWPAEERHQDYWKKNPEAFMCELKASGRKRV